MSITPALAAKEMAHEGGAESSPHTPSPPHPAHLPAPDTTFQQQILQNQSPRKNHIAERAKQTLESNFLQQLKKQQELQQEILLQHFEQQRQQLAEQHEQQLRHHLKLWEQRKAIEEAAFREAREAQEAREVRERLERDRVEVLRKKDKHEHSANASMQVKQKLQEFLRNKIATNANGTVPASKWFSPNENYCHSSIHRGIVKSPSGESITSTGATATAHPYRLPPAFSAAAASDYPLRKTASEPNMLKVRIGKSRVFERRHAPLARRPKPRRRQDGGSPRGSPPGAPGGPGAAPPIREEEEAAAGGAELLFSSPSLPNISLGRPHAPPAHPAACPLPVLREAEGARGGKRPLGRTHSAPLPLGDAALQPPKAHVRDQIRKSVLTRAHDAAKQQLREEEGEVIDLTRRPLEPPASAPDPPAVPLARALSSPLVGARVPATGLAYDPIMLKHGCGCGANAPTHPEHGGRLQSVWARLHETGLAARTERTRPRRATLQELQSVHTEGHVLAFAGRREGGAAGVAAGGAGAGGARALVRLACGGLGVDADTAWSEAHTPPAARTAAGALLDLATRAALGHLANGFAVVRPPGHHAEPNQAMGFCFFNNVAIAARVLQTRLKLQRILIVDWDVHHGNGTQQIFYSDPGVLYMSIHRHDDGNFFPGTGAAGECGAGAGLGYSVNVPWSCGVDPPMADAEYLAAFRTIIMPIAREYNPEIVLVSCGFDAAAGHPPPLGGYRVSAACFAHMTQDLMTLANGKVVLSLEGGYDLPAMCDCAAECVKALLGARAAPPALAELARPPAPPAQAALRAVLRVQAQHWPRIKRYAELIGMSALEAGTAGGVGGVVGGAGGAGQSERDADTAAAMATLSMHHPRPHRSAENSRSVSEEPMEQDEGK